jgi:transcriptional regulator with XRE-family HTH domain
MVIWMSAAGRGGSMTPRADTPSSEHRRLRGRLRQARVALKLTQRDVADALDWSTSKLIRIENGSVGISVTDLKALLLHYEITDKADVDSLVEMARVSKRSEWWQEYRHEVGQQFLKFVGIEASAIRIRQYQNLLFPGLLQSPEYIKNLVTIGSRNEKHAQVLYEIRLRRQELITIEHAPESFFIVDESVLHRQIGDAATMREQLLRVKEFADRPNITVQIMPFSAGVHRGMKSSFEILELSEEPDDYALLLEQAYKDELIPDPNEEAREYVQIFFEMEKAALPATETARMIDQRLEEMDKDG